jgi:hypothetical protein
MALAAAPLAAQSGGDSAGPASAPAVWKFDSLAAVGGVAPIVIGAPIVAIDGSIKSVAFNGSSDALNVPANPIKGWSRFTLEVLIRPDLDGQPEQRFFHIQQRNPNSRALLEIRLTPEGKWALDAFLEAGPDSRALLDRSKLHPAGEWSWVAMEYDGQNLTSFVNGVKELQGEVDFTPMVSGQTSVGVRINRVYWFKGRIAEARFYPSALAPSALARVPGP